jgi:hypothetical protein
MGERVEQYQARPLPPEMLEPVQVRCVVAFGLGDRMFEVGEIVTVSRARCSYLCFLGLATEAE